jgi:glucokinase
MPADRLTYQLCHEVLTAASAQGTKPHEIGAVGIALPGLMRQGVVEEAPNLPQLKGCRIQEILTQGLRREGVDAPVHVMNDADAAACGLAVTHGKLDRIVRVWTLGVGIGYGRYPLTEGVWEGGHCIVSLDDKERFCGCGGRGHMEGIMGHRAMRLRFLDMEPEEVFEAAKAGEQRCMDFKRLWHKALAAATASSIHMDGAGKFFLTGFNVRFVDTAMLRDYLQQMVTMSPLQSYSMEIVQDETATRVLGAAVTAELAAQSRLAISAR